VRHAERVPRTRSRPARTACHAMIAVADLFSGLSLGVEGA
jgi:hypothetical protein